MIEIFSLVMEISDCHFSLHHQSGPSPRNHRQLGFSRLESMICDYRPPYGVLQDNPLGILNERSASCEGMQNNHLHALVQERLTLKYAELLKKDGGMENVIGILNEIGSDHIQKNDDRHDEKARQLWPCDAYLQAFSLFQKQEPQ